MQVESPQLICQNFIESLHKHVNPSNSLLIEASNFNALGLEANHKKVRGFNWQEDISENQKYDFIVADLPIGMTGVKTEIGGHQLNIKRNWLFLASSLRMLSDEGIGLALVEPPAFGYSGGNKFTRALEEEGYFLRAIVELPEGILQPQTSIRPVLVLFSSTPKDSVFVGELINSQQASSLAEAFITSKEGDNLTEGMTIRQGEFIGCNNLRFKQQLAKLKTQYKSYSTEIFSEIVESLKSVRSGDEFDDLPSTIYIPKLGTSEVTYDMSKVSIKHHNVFQIKISDKVDSQYVSAFFNSDLGKLILSSCRTGTVIPKLDRTLLLNTEIALPTPREQDKIVDTHKKLSSLTEAVIRFQKELALNPTSAEAINQQFEIILEQIGELTDSDRAMSIIRAGESKTIEFKESLCLDVRKGIKEKYIELAALKTIVAFLNTDGGTLLIGVNDDGDVPGISAEVEKLFRNNDKFLLHFKNLLTQKIGEQYYPFINQKLVSLMGNTVLMVECKSCSEPCYLDQKDFYVRTNPATDKLDGPKLVQYVQNHFGTK